MAGFDWKALVRTVAPVIGTALGGPVGNLAAQALSTVFLGTAEGTEDQIAEAVAKATPEQLLALRQAEKEFVVRMRELDIDVEKIAAADRDSARKREAATGDKVTPRTLAFIVVGAFLAMVASVLMGKVAGITDPTAAAMIGALIGNVSSKADLVFGYYFGSSAGSQQKSETLDRLSRQQ
jgi:uncharacterized membrane protein YeaQ/YmgE (transglycosylase-associated protein family)